MPRLTDSEIFEIARDCRIRYIADFREETYEDVLPVADEEDLCEHCALISQRLFEVFKDKGLRPVYCVAEDHVYVQVRGKNYDLTAMQFNNVLFNNVRRVFPPVFVFGRWEKPWGPVLFKASSTAKLQKWLGEEGWPTEQVWGWPPEKVYAS